VAGCPTVRLILTNKLVEPAASIFRTNSIFRMLFVLKMEEADSSETMVKI
jgi:hypothetical protein